ncbi:HAD family hydrolase [bacterium]|nr:MAG: HAD family hydrolase [bacterium]
MQKLPRRASSLKGEADWDERILRRQSLKSVLPHLDAVIFDIDGTLLDSNDANAYAWRTTFREFGKDVPQAEIRAAIGKGGDNLLPDFFSEEELKTLKEPLSKRRGELYDGELLPKMKPFSLVREFCERLKADGRRIAIATSATEEELKVSLDLIGISDLVEAKATIDDAEGSKPDPDIFLAALERLGNPDPARVLVVGDTPYDVEAAERAGMQTVAVLTGGFSRESLAGALATFGSVAELFTRYEETPFAR